MTQRVAAAAVGVIVLGAQALQAQPAGPVVPIVLAQPEVSGTAPATLTLQDALQRARQSDAQLQLVVADAQSAREDSVQARAGLLPTFSFTTQYLGNQGNDVNPNGRFVSMDGVKMYRAWGVLHQELSPAILTATPLGRARALEAAATARLEVARRGLSVTVTRSYYALVAAQRKYGTAQGAAEQAARFLDVAREQQRLGQVALSDVIKADIQSQQQMQAFREAALVQDNARLALAVLVSPAFNENFTVVDDLSSSPPLPAFADLSAKAGLNNPDLRAAQEALTAANQDIRAARSAFFPSLAIDAVYGIEANEFALHSRIAAQPELGVLPNLGYALTANLTVPIWDWGGGRSRLRQAQIKAKAATATLSRAQREIVAGLYARYNESLVAKAAVESAQRVVDLATESLRLTNLRYRAGEATALEVVDAQNTLVQVRNGFDDAGARYRVALADLQTITGSF